MLIFCRQVLPAPEISANSNSAIVQYTRSTQFLISMLAVEDIQPPNTPKKACVEKDSYGTALWFIGKQYCTKVDNFRYDFHFIAFWLTMFNLPATKLPCYALVPISMPTQSEHKYIGLSSTFMHFSSNLLPIQNTKLYCSSSYIIVH